MLTEKTYEDGYNFSGIIGVKGNTYAERKIDLLAQLGYHNLPHNIFDGLTETEIDRKARRIIMS